MWNTTECCTAIKQASTDTHGNVGSSLAKQREADCVTLFPQTPELATGTRAVQRPEHGDLWRQGSETQKGHEGISGAAGMILLLFSLQMCGLQYTC